MTYIKSRLFFWGLVFGSYFLGKLVGFPMLLVIWFVAVTAVVWYCEYQYEKKTGKPFERKDPEW